MSFKTGLGLLGLVILLLTASCAGRSASRTQQPVQSDSLSVAVEGAEVLAPIPPPLQQKVLAFVVTHYASSMPLVRVDSMFSSRLDDQATIYGVRVTYGIGDVDYLFFGACPNASRVADSLVLIYGRWMADNERGFNPRYRLLRGPVLEVVPDTTLTKTAGQICIRERRHNGTVVNCAMEYYFNIDPQTCNLVFRRGIEKTAIAAHTDGCFIERSFINSALDVLVQERCDGQATREIGMYASGTGEILYCRDEEYRAALITVSGDSVLHHPPHLSF